MLRVRVIHNICFTGSDRKMAKTNLKKCRLMPKLIKSTNDVSVALF